MKNNLKKYTPDTCRECPEELLKKIFDSNDTVLFGTKHTKGKVSCDYIPGELMLNGKPFIVHTTIDYDGIGNANLPKEAIIKEWNELAEIFPENKFYD